MVCRGHGCVEWWLENELLITRKTFCGLALSTHMTRFNLQGDVVDEKLKRKFEKYRRKQHSRRGDADST